MLDPSGEVVETYRYSVFGEERIYDAQNQLKTEALSSWRYAGKRHDAKSGFIYFGLRYYDPLSNVWLTPDPIGREGGPNLYAYVLNNPLSFFDRFGLNPEEDVNTTQTVESSHEAVSSNESVNSNGSSKDSAIDRDRREQNRPSIVWQRVKEFTSAVAHSFWSPEDHILDRDDDLRQTGIDAFNGNYANIAERWNQMDSLSRVRFTGNCVGLACSLFPVARAASGFKYGVKYCQKTFKITKNAWKANSVGQRAESINASINLKKKLTQLEKLQEEAKITKVLPDGRIRYYSKEYAAKTPGPTRGSSYVSEWNPKTGKIRGWQESYDRLGKVNRVHPKSINGQEVTSMHYPPTYMELMK